MKIMLNICCSRLGSDPVTHIFNVDETAFSCRSSGKRVIGTKDANRINKLTGNNDKLNFTVQLCCDANGFVLPMYVLFKGAYLYYSWTLNGAPDCRYNVSKNEWMDTARFKDWFKKVFLAHAKILTGPKLLYLDGHRSHIDMDLAKLARENKVTIICQPAHATHF